MFWSGTVGGVLTRGLITLAVSTGSIDLPQYISSFMTTVLWVMRDERVSFSRLFLFFFWHFLGFCVTFSLSRRAVCWR